MKALRTVRGLATALGLGLVAAAAVGTSLVVAPGLVGSLGALLALVALAIAVVDLRQYIVPDELTIAAVLLGLGVAFVAGPSGAGVESLGLALCRGLLLGALFFALREAYFRLRNRQGLGLGDVKLSVAAGVWLDLDFIAVAIEMAALSAIAAYLLRQLASRRRVRATARLPFGLFFAPSIWLAWLVQTAVS